MKSISKFAGAVVAVYAATVGAAFAVPVMPLPEPGSLALVGVAIAGLIAVSRRGKK